MKRLGARKVLFTAPLLAVFAAWALCSTRVETATSATTDVITDATTNVASSASADEVAMAASNCTYCNNASHSQVVGQFGYDCCNNPFRGARRRGTPSAAAASPASRFRNSRR